MTTAHIKIFEYSLDCFSATITSTEIVMEGKTQFPMELYQDLLPYVASQQMLPIDMLVRTVYGEIKFHDLLNIQLLGLTYIDLSTGQVHREGTTIAVTVGWQIRVAKIVAPIVEIDGEIINEAAFPLPRLGYGGFDAN